MADAPRVWTVLSMMEWATAFFEEREVRSPRYSIEWLLADVLDVKRLDLYMAYDRPLSSEELDTLRPMVKRRALHEPLQYITGEADFYNTRIKVEPGVLIPRQETEQLVDLIVHEQAGDQALKVLDIGTGSGCIPVALKNKYPNWSVSASDISEEALGVAKSNATLNECDIQFIRDDLFNPTQFGESQQFNIIVSNPPYILTEEKEDLDKEVREFEPELALFCDSTQSMYSALERFCGKHLLPEGTLYLELHADYANEVSSIFQTEGWNTRLEKDLDDRPRFLVATR